MIRAVVLARGLGNRMRAVDERAALSAAQEEAADAGHKALMPLHGRRFLDFVLSALADAGYRDVGLVVGPDHGVVRRHYEVEARPERIRITFLVQSQPRGTADAVLCAARWTAGEPFVTLNADNLYPEAVLRALAGLDEPGLPVFEQDDLVASSNISASRVAAFALLHLDDTGYLEEIIEKPGETRMTEAGPRALISMNCWRFDHTIFAACRDVARSPRGEFELPQAVSLAITRGSRFRAVRAAGPVLDLSARADIAEIARRLHGVDPRP
jgi:glucose-1-phosphate thymidylyltransferase